jgi:[ribosomal protein S5]-alanine N-acetyltransferase
MRPRSFNSMPLSFPLQCDGFTLRYLKESDAPAIARNINEESTLSKLSRVPIPYQVKDAEGFIRQCLKEYETKALNFAIDVEGEAVGVIGFSEVLPHRAEIGYWLAERVRGRGIARKALEALTEYGFHTLGFVRIYAMVFAGNTRSIRVLESAGYEKEGYLRKQVLKEGRHIDVELFAKIRDDGAA